MKQPVQFFPTQLRSYSDVYGSREKTKYRIGRPDGSPMTCYNISESEAVTIMKNLPPELLEVVKDHYGLVEGTKEVIETNVTDKAIETELDDSIDLQELSRDQLRDLCKQLGIKGYAKWTKEELIDAITALAEDEEE